MAGINQDKYLDFRIRGICDCFGEGIISQPNLLPVRHGGIVSVAIGVDKAQTLVHMFMPSGIRQLVSMPSVVEDERVIWLAFGPNLANGFNNTFRSALFIPQCHVVCTRLPCQVLHHLKCKFSVQWTMPLHWPSPRLRVTGVVNARDEHVNLALVWHIFSVIMCLLVVVLVDSNWLEARRHEMWIEHGVDLWISCGHLWRQGLVVCLWLHLACHGRHERDAAFLRLKTMIDVPSRA
mmetsp:Transcript_98236/g.189705  ORF Transcript_98236/g.189705 Transcript_98236/m.189705 type:complete len:236 (-) Transcript_98236:38-745(-)